MVKKKVMEYLNKVKVVYNMKVNGNQGVNTERVN